MLLSPSRLVVITTILFVVPFAFTQTSTFHNAPPSATLAHNPQTGKPEAIEAGKKLYGQDCASCHGPAGDGTGNVPALKSGHTQQAKDGEIFWFITHGDPNNGMPAWSALKVQERWQLVSYIKAINTAGPAIATGTPAASTAVNKSGSPFIDYRNEKPGAVRKITMADLPQPYATKSAGNGPRIVPRPKDAWPQTLPGFKVDLYAANLENPRELRTAPNGDIFVAEQHAGKVLVFRGMTADGKPQQTSAFITDLDGPFGIAFYPLGPNPQWIYIGNTTSLVRIPYQNGDLKARGVPQKLFNLPPDGHDARNVRFSNDGKTLFVAVGSASNVDDPDTTPEEKNRADILAANPDGSNLHVYASGIRNPVGLAVNPKTGELWCSVNERDALGDNLVPDYITHVQPGGFYGWPWYYIGDHQDPRHPGKHPELKDKVIVPDVLLQPHNASLGITFYDGKMFPKEYDGDIFAAEHGSWNRSVRVGYEVIRVPLHQTGHATGEYEDFVTGFVTPDGHVWGRPVGVTVAPDGSLLVSDDGSNSIWRVSHQ
ncbi:MAG TPA: PQQ-dependent sugar dehydrogenase [Candidatus Koribacter sp.]